MTSRRRSDGGRIAAALAGLVLAAGPAVAATWDYLAEDELLCTPDEHTCIRGTLTFERNYRVLRLRGRVESAPGPGTFEITVIGTTRQGYNRWAPMEIDIRGRLSEIVDYKMIPDYPEVYEWKIERIEFRAKEEEGKD